MAAEAGLIAERADVIEFAEESVEDGFEEVPVVGATGEEGAKPELGAGGFVDVDGSEIALAAGGDIEAEAVATGIVNGPVLGGEDLSFEGQRGFVFEESLESLKNEFGDFVFTGGLVEGVEFAELGLDLFVLEVEAFDLIIEAAAFDGAPINNADAAGRGIAEVGLLVDFFEAGAGAAIGEELIGTEIEAANAIDDVEEAEFEGVGHGDAVVEVPGGGGRGRVERGSWFGEGWIIGLVD